jgi:hypothetical protein
MKMHVLVAGALALAVIAPVSANALTINNQDKSPYTLKVKPKSGKEMDLTVKASASTDVDCKAGCSITLGKTSEKVDGKVGKITIKNGKFVMY